MPARVYIKPEGRPKTYHIDIQCAPPEAHLVSLPDLKQSYPDVRACMRCCK